MTLSNRQAAHRRVSDADRARMVELYKQGLDVPAITKTVGWTAGALYRALKAGGVTLRKPLEQRKRGSICARARNRIGVW